MVQPWFAKTVAGAGVRSNAGRFASGKLPGKFDYAANRALFFQGGS
jgi:hypothetical protein